MSTDSPSQHTARPEERAPGALELIDESFHRLRAAPAGILGIYYAATLPFVLGLLYFWGDLAHGGSGAVDRSTGAAFGLAWLFLWMKTGQAWFAQRLRELFNHRAAVPLPARGWAQLFLVQGVLHSVGLFVLAVAAVLTVPFGWAYAFAQSVTAVGAGETGTVREVLRRAVRAGVRWPRQNHLMLFAMSLLGLFVWINLLAAVFGLPYLAKLCTGEENVFTRGGISQFNSTFLSVPLALTYLALDPVVKTFYALRCFYTESFDSGEDLASELRALPPVQTGAAASLGQPAAPGLAATRGGRPAIISVLLAAALSLAAGLLSPAPAWSAPEPAKPPDTAATIRPVELDQSIKEVMRRREFAWRLPPRPPARGETPDLSIKNETARRAVRWLRDTIAGVKEQLQRAAKVFGRWVRLLWKKLFPKKKPSDQPPVELSMGEVPVTLLRTVAYVLIGVILLSLLYLVGRAWRQRVIATPTGAAQTGTPVAADLLADEDAVASQLPEDEWLTLARRLLDAGERRLALRAFFLSILAALGRDGLLAIARHKSNRDYQSELRRRVRDRAELLGAFARNVGRYERVWYGRHEASGDLLEKFLADQETIRASANAFALAVADRTAMA